MLMLYSEWEH